MRLEQLRAVAEIVRRGFSVSGAAAALNVPQPAVSRQLRALENELGVELFVRSRKRLRGLTRPGEAIMAIASQMLREAESLVRIGRDFAAADEGRLTVATTHTQARYALPVVVEQFVERFPRVQVLIRQGDPTEVAGLVARGEADICIGSASAEHDEDVVSFPCYSMDRVILTPRGHPLLKARRLTLETLARYPVITYDAPFIGRSRMMNAFTARGLEPRIVLSAIDTDVIKAYVERGLGIAVVASLAFDPKRDRGLRAIDASRLFEPNTIFLGVRRHDYLMGYMHTFIEIFAPHLDRQRVISGMNPRAARRGQR